MSGFELLIDNIDGHLTAAVVRKTVLVDLYTDTPDTACAWAALYVGKVTKIEKRLDAAIVDLGAGLFGFLPAKHIHFPDEIPGAGRPRVSEALKPGQTVLVQVKSEAKLESDSLQKKLPRLTMKTFVKGQYLFYSPIAPIIQPRRYNNQQLLALLDRFKAPGGWLIKSSAHDTDADSLTTEAETLIAEWHVLEKEIKASDEPRLIRRGRNAVERVLNDYNAKTFDHIYAGNKEILNLVMTWSQAREPKLATSKRLRLYKPEKSGQRLFDLHDVYSELAALQDAVVPLNGGGSIVIEDTHAMTVIDVNQGQAPAAYAANIEAAAECARQMRLRNLSGVILIDFINMHKKTERFRLIEALENALAHDYAGTSVHGFTRLGIVEVTRKRRSTTLVEKRALGPAKQRR